MLNRLYVKNYVLIDSLEIDFPEGLVIITGQTGAGKSIILGSIALVLGGKADAAIIGPSAENCVVEAEFDASDESLRDVLEENGVDWDGGHLILRRVVNRSGRSRAFVNDSPVNLPLLGEISSRLVDIHSQHQTLLLSDKKFQMGVLDYFAGNRELLNRCASEYSTFLSLRGEIDQVKAKLTSARAEGDYMKARFAQLDEAALVEGELEELEAEQRCLANAEEIKSNLFAVENLFSGEQEGGLPVDSALREVERHLEKVLGYIPSAKDLLERLSACRVELDDIVGEISDINSRTELSEQRLQQVEERLSLLYGLMTRFSCSSVEQLIAQRDALSESLCDTSMLEERLGVLQRQLETVQNNLAEISSSLHKARVQAAPLLAAEIQQAIRFLELEQAVFEVEVLNAPQSASGTDSVMFKFSSTGRAAVDIARCASGGELSRIMLCLKEMLARFKNMPTMIFDEIDTGVSGSVADKMGQMICRMGANMQVFAITHLPQVAAKGNAHFLVSKDSGITSIKKLSAKDRTLEIARMLSGSQITDAAIANARILLDNPSF